MLSLRVALQRVAHDWTNELQRDLCDQCGRMPAARWRDRTAVCLICAEARRVWTRKHRARRAHPRRFSCLLLVIAMLGVAQPHAAAQPARVRVFDGDTFTVDKQRWRLWGIDAPELHQCCADGAGRNTACGELAREALARLIGDQAPRCFHRGRSYGRAVGRCDVGMVDLAAEMVRVGMALDFPRFSRGEYAGVEREARRLRQGVWAGRFVEPWVWRDTRRRESQRRVRCTTTASTWLAAGRRTTAASRGSQAPSRLFARFDRSDAHEVRRRARPDT